MKKNLATAVALIAALGFVGSAGLAPAQQSDDPKNQVIDSINLDQADVRDALKVLFKNVKAQYTVAPDVQGAVTVNLHNQPFETGLRYILNQVDASWRVDGGIYEISKKQAVDQGVDVTTPGEQVSTVNLPIRIPIMHADPALILQFLRGIDNTNEGPEITQLQYAGGGGVGGGGIGGGGVGGGGIGGGGIGGGGIGGGSTGGGGSGGGSGGGFPGGGGGL